MATGFIRSLFVLRSPNCRWLAATLLLLPAGSLAAEVSVIGVFPGKAAVLVIDGASPRTVKIGQKLGPVRVLAVDRAGATVDIDGTRRTLRMGQHVSSEPSAASSTPKATLSADAQGHFVADGAINGAHVRFIVDTGATLVSLPSGQARRLGLDFTKGQKGVTQTANGPAIAYRLKLDSVKVGDIELLNVDAVVLDEAGLAQALLGMSFLNRVEMRREGRTMTLTRRF